MSSSSDVHEGFLLMSEQIKELMSSTVQTSLDVICLIYCWTARQEKS